jgi:FixJ family two-component response regulator
MFCAAPQSIDCVLLDLSMPKLSGDEVHREMKIAREGIPIILMSGYAEQEILDRFDGIELTGFLQKPVPASDIVTAVREALA